MKNENEELYCFNSLKQECISVGCVWSAAVAVSFATHAPCHACPLPHTPLYHACPPPCEQNHRRLWKHNLAVTSLRAVKRRKCFTNLGVRVAEFPTGDAGVAVVPARAAHSSPLPMLTDLNPTHLELSDVQLNRVQPHCNICENILKEIEENAARKK